MKLYQKIKPWQKYQLLRFW